MTRRRRATSPIISRWTASRTSAGAPAVSAAAATITAGGATAHAAPQRGTAALVAAMTLEEKLSFVQGRWDDPQLQTIGESGYVPGVPRLGIPPLRLTDGPAGIRAAQPATALPVPVALSTPSASPTPAATSRPTEKTRWSAPGRSPRPSKASRARGAIDTTKHSAANNQETDRQTINAHVAEPATRHRQGAGTRPSPSARRTGHAVRPVLAIELSHRGGTTSG
ncbi:hypothetical protein [Actinomadura napierensis]|uniref:Uncharacterized protein n=1 Tax=Actinomadura napierensis TaxID=267854 RepID=A0ABP5M1R3_9ACTN